MSAPEWLAEVCAALERAHPHEGCGVVLEGPQGARVQVLRNASAGDPRLGFAFAPREWLRTSMEAEARGERVGWVFHSHVDGPAYLSAADRVAAAPGGQLLLPGVLQLVIGMQAGSAREARAYRWQDGDFRELWEWRRP